MRMLMFVVAALVVLVAQAGADEYWIAYEGNDFPENEGWTRIYGNEDGYQQGGAERSTDNGIFVLDSLRHQMIVDFYETGRAIDPGADELFVAEWRVWVRESHGPRDAGLTIARDEGGTLSFRYSVEELVSEREGWSVPIAPLEPHSYRLESWDMVNYGLWIDGCFVRSGWWDLDSINESFVNFGDVTQGGGARSLSEWDYFRFGVVPEPSGATGLVLLSMIVFGTERRNLRTRG